MLGRRFEKLAREIGGETQDGIRLLERMAHIMQQERDKETTPLDRARGPYEALGRIHVSDRRGRPLLAGGTQCLRSSPAASADSQPAVALTFWPRRRMGMTRSA